MSEGLISAGPHAPILRARGGRDSISVNRDLSLAETRAAGRFKVRRCLRMHEAAHKLNG